jgi:hemoglobin
MSTKPRSLYDQLGGEEAIGKLVDKFYDRVLDDPELEPFFQYTPMEKLRSMQMQFFAAALGGPENYSGQPIHYVHQGRGITSRHLTRFMGHLLVTIQDAHPNSQEVDEMIERISMYADSIIGGTPGDSE